MTDEHTSGTISILRALMNNVPRKSKMPVSGNPAIVAESPATTPASTTSAIASGICH